MRWWQQLTASQPDCAFFTGKSVPLYPCRQDDRTSPDVPKGDTPSGACQRPNVMAARASSS